jgi:hypothetical protein
MANANGALVAATLTSSRAAHRIETNPGAPVSLSESCELNKRRLSVSAPDELSLRPANAAVIARSVP